MQHCHILAKSPVKSAPHCHTADLSEAAARACPLATLISCRGMTPVMRSSIELLTPFDLVLALQLWEQGTICMSHTDSAHLPNMQYVWQAGQHAS